MTTATRACHDCDVEYEVCDLDDGGRCPGCAVAVRPVPRSLAPRIAATVLSRDAKRDRPHQAGPTDNHNRERTVRWVV
jgi:hypothetical protein